MSILFCKYLRSQSSDLYEIWKLSSYEWKPPKFQGGAALLDWDKLLDKEIYIPNNKDDGHKHKGIDTENLNDTKDLLEATRTSQRWGMGIFSSPNTHKLVRPAAEYWPKPYQTLWFLKKLKYLNHGSLKFQLFFKEVSKKIQGSFKSGSKEFQGYFKKVSSVFQGRLKAVSREFSMWFKGVWKKFKGNIMEVSNVFQGCFKEVARVFQKSV